MIRFQYDGPSHPTSRSSITAHSSRNSVPGHAMWRLEPETAEWAGQPMPPGMHPWPVGRQAHVMHVRNFHNEGGSNPRLPGIIIDCQCVALLLLGVPGVVCRLRHLATNMLLAAGEPDRETGERKICMSVQRESSATLWKLHSFTAEPGVKVNEALLRDSCHVFLQHACGMWLTLGGAISKIQQVLHCCIAEMVSKSAL